MLELTSALNEIAGGELFIEPSPVILACEEKATYTGVIIIIIIIVVAAAAAVVVVIVFVSGCSLSVMVCTTYRKRGSEWRTNGNISKVS